MAEARETIRHTWEAYLATFLVEEEQRIVAEMRPLLQSADAAVDRLQAILRQEDAAALEGFIVDELYQRIDPVSEAFGRLKEVQLDVAET
ncbi:hypothetical protein, partial [Litchfieldella qijiaojingensis]|uniref:hypothetical protein n=1 Tax=Litchfieldella qijiaojingensis TaxID=980347 RepID=UPI001E5F7789